MAMRFRFSVSEEYGNQGEERFRNLLLDLGKEGRAWTLVVSYSWPSTELLMLPKPPQLLLPLLVVLEQTGRPWDLLG